MDILPLLRELWPYLLGGGSMLVTTILFIWRIRNNKITNFSKRQKLLKDKHEGEYVRANYRKSKISSIQCYPPKSRILKLLRYFPFIEGRTRVTLDFYSAIQDDWWDNIKDGLENEDIHVIDSGHKYDQGTSYITIEYSSLSSEKLDENTEKAAEIVTSFIYQKELENIPDW